MNVKVEEALEVTLRNWNMMSGSGQSEAESTADEFESSFYQFIDAVREWVNALDQRPQTLDELLKLTLIKHILNKLPAPLHLNFETEAELILEHTSRIDDEKYD
ncbi:hypothetical protein GK047_02075 [Paenibacillus sp. SYP-B3998]|uniref:Uncharacterized protein n=1 Tax=Paenibacillus sp. SYP-B3998 TaxID=2678564 RepID=A0A6G3ZRR3_9BACL|nr:hypothetical protein [Paenibacillus sp. SYP-B3998]NEW04805.1 hypothetical protein [Paenibacillus sp. SYP-B3998]